MIAEQQSQLVRMGLRAIEVYREALDSDDLGIAAATATKILEGTGVLNKKDFQETLQHGIWETRQIGSDKTALSQKRPPPGDEPAPRMPPTPSSQAASEDRSEDEDHS